MLNQIQQALEAIYQIDTSCSVEDYLITQEDLSHFPSALEKLHHPHEALLVAQQNDTLDVGLMFEKKLLSWACAQRWEDRERYLLCDPDLHRLNLLIEGVSHFVYLTWSAAQEKAVTQLEMELQAEVDKFLLMAQPLKSSETTDRILRHLFQEVEWRHELSCELRTRYEEASRFASRYCDYLRTCFLGLKSYPHLQQEICSFYRMNQLQKIQHIDS